MRSVSLFLCLLSALPLPAATWYVRPRDWDAAIVPAPTHNGQTYDMAWDGYAGIVWSSISPGDTIYLCGTFVNGVEGIAYGLRLDTAPSGTANARITISGLAPDHPEDPGILVGCNAFKAAAAAGWNDNSDGTYWFSTTEGGGCYEGAAGSASIVQLKPTASQEACVAAAGSYYHDSVADKMWYHPYGASRLDYYYHDYGWAILNRARSYITYSNLTIVAGMLLLSRWDNSEPLASLHDPTLYDEHVIVENCTFRGTKIQGEKSRYLTIRNCVFLNQPNAIYIYGNKEAPPGITIANNYFDCGIPGWNRASWGWSSMGNQDCGSMQLQVGPNWRIEGNHIKRAACNGIYLYRRSTYDCRDMRVRYNRIDLVGDGDNPGGDDNYGIIITGSQYSGWSDSWARADVSYNIVQNCGGTDMIEGTNLTGCGIRIRPGNPTNPADRMMVVGNTVSGCNFNFFIRQNSDEYGYGFLLKNNISLSPNDGGYHLFLSYTPTPSSPAPLISYNCFFPDTSDGDHQFSWKGSYNNPNPSTDYADFVSRAAASGVTVANCLTSDPLFVDALSGDFTLQIDSPCIDAGQNLGDTYDDGLSRGSVWPQALSLVDQDTYGRGWEIGAYVYTGPYPVQISSFNGSVVKSPDKMTYEHGETVTLEAVPDSGCLFGGWSGDLRGSTNPVSLVMNGHKSIIAYSGIYTLGVSSTSNGSVTRSSNRPIYGLGETVTLTAVPDAGYEFGGWAGALTGGSNPGMLTMDSDKVVTASFRPISPPTVGDCRPEPDAIQVPLNSLVRLRVWDDGRGVDANTVAISLSNTVVYAGNVPSYSSALGVCRRIGTPASYTYVYQSNRRFDFDQTIRLTVHAADLAGNVMPEYSYSFTTEMRAFGRNLKASGGLDSLDKGNVATVRDSSGNIWAVWHAGAAGQRDIYVSKLARGGDSFGDPVRLTTGTGDESNPDFAIGTDNRLYVVWQDNRRGSWDVYVKTSVDGITWSDERRVTDSKSNHVHPALVVDGQSPSRAHIAWQDDGAGNQDIWVASSNDGFATKTVSSITSDASDQTGPQMAVDASNAVYLVWTDRRNGSDDIYGASSAAGPWTNVPFVMGPGTQNSPAMATEATGSVLHVAWVDDASGNQDIRYASSNGLPGSPLLGVNVVDDTLGANQTAPAIATVGSVGNGLKVFVGWRDERNITPNKGDADLYFVEVRTPAATNILVGDDGAGSDQSEPAVGLDGSGYPYVVWTDNRASAQDIYYCGSTYMDPEALASDLVSASAGGTVGKTTVSGLDGVSVVIPAGACAPDVTVTITPILNPQPNSAASVISYDFGPSGLEFSLPVTITIPYAVAEFGGHPPVPCWYDSRTGTVSQQGIADVETLSISASIHAMRFRATHFTPYVLLAASPSTQGAGGGGCSLSPVSGTSGAIEFFLPYILLASVMIALRRRDGRRYPESVEKPSSD